MKETYAGLVPASAPGFGVTWGGPPRAAGRALTVAAAAAVIAGIASPAGAAPVASTADHVSVIVQELPRSGNAPERAVSAFGGEVVRSLSVIGGFEAQVPADRVDALRAVPGVRHVTENAAVSLSSAEVDQQVGLNGSLRRVTNEMTGAAAMWDAGFTGAGVDVALIDSGVAPVEGLTTAGKVVNGPDLSLEALDCATPVSCSKSPVYGLDTYGHGTHMAGIIAGRDSGAPARVTSRTTGSFVGVAPDARVVSVKVADAVGRTDVSQLIAGIDWVIQNRQSDGLNIRVLNLSVGTDGVQEYQLDPLAFAVEQAWQAGIVVVVSSGNSNNGTSKLDNPAYDPYVLAVGASDGKGTSSFGDDTVPSWSAVGDSTRTVDLVAPGQSIVSLRVPNSYLDAQFESARTGTRFMRGSGTSQAAAVVSGTAALLLQQRPGLTPDQVKGLLMGNARALSSADKVAQGKGLVDVAKARTAGTPSTVQTWTKSTGMGSLDRARGTAIVDHNGTKLTGEVDFTGRAWQADAVTKGLRNGVAKGDLNGLSWNGLSWNGLSWNGLSWNGLSWNGLSWNGLSWNGLSWNGLSWNGLSWNGLSWNGLSWG